MQNLRWLMLCVCFACSTSDPSRSGIAAGATAWLDEYDHEVEVTCPCRVEQGGFPTLDECHRVLVIEGSTADCLSEQLESGDSAELRATVQCMAEASRTRAACLATAACGSDAMNACYELAAECPMFDLQLLARAFAACPDSILLGRLMP